MCTPFEAITSIGTALLAAITAVLAFFTYGLWKSTLALVEGAENTAERELRAYLTVAVGGGYYQERAKDLKFEVRPVLINGGKTPAHKVRYKAAAGILPRGLPANFDFRLPSEASPSGHLGPQQNFGLNAHVPELVDDALAESVKRGNGPLCLYMWGTITYEDVFKRQRWTKFCLSIFWIQVDGKEIISGFYADRHNEADQ